MGNKVFQVTQYHLDRSPLRWYDLNKWVFAYNGDLYGFCETEQEAVKKAQNFDPAKDAIIKIKF
jgi:hypothetical protein